jgi:hypothetical protein
VVVCWSWLMPPSAPAKKIQNDRPTLGAHSNVHESASPVYLLLSDVVAGQRTSLLPLSVHVEASCVHGLPPTPTFFEKSRIGHLQKQMEKITDAHHDSLSRWTCDLAAEKFVHTCLASGFVTCTCSNKPLRIHSSSECLKKKPNLLVLDCRSKATTGRTTIVVDQLMYNMQCKTLHMKPRAMHTHKKIYSVIFGHRLPCRP